jgi:hypothetical protein
MATMTAVRIHQYGGPEALRYEDAPRPEPGPRSSCSMAGLTEVLRFLDKS